MISPLQLTNVTTRRPKGASGGHKVSASRAAQASEARLYIYSWARIVGIGKRSLDILNTIMGMPKTLGERAFYDT